MPKYLTRSTLLFPMFMLAACGQQDAVEPAAEDTADAAATAMESPASEEADPGLPRSAAPEGARVFFVTPADGDTVASPVTIEFGIAGMAVAPAGVDQEGSGHHHLVVDAELPDFGMPIPKSDNYIHFGDGSTSTSIELAPGEHTLQLILGDHLHIPHDPPVHSERIRVTVE